MFRVPDRIENNGFSNAVQDGREAHFPDDPPRVLPGAAFGCYDEVDLCPT